MRRLVAQPEAKNKFFFVGDLNQKVYPKHHSGPRAGFNFQGRAVVLTQNYRKHSQVLQAAFHLPAAFPPQGDDSVQGDAP